jgi:hypothetical protein
MTRTNQIRAAERISQLIAESAKNPLHRPTKKTMPKKTMLKIRDARAMYSARLDDIVILYPEFCASNKKPRIQYIFNIRKFFTS